MAFGFRECCNEFSYFTVTGIPGNVSEFETYYVRTIEGLNFCATYVQLPTLNYQAPNYILLELAQQTSCESCLVLFPCPEEDIILVNQFTAGSVQIDTDCQVNTLQPMIVQCQTISPTFSNTLDGTVALLVVGGTPPYTFLGASPSEVLGVFQDGDVYTVYQNVSAGTYTTTTVDSTGDFSITRNCVLSGPPPIPVGTPIVTPASFFGAPDGSIQLNIIGGIPPYTIVYEGEEITLPLTNLAAGTYYIQITDTEGTLVEVEAVVTQPDYPNYSQYLCATFNKCGTEFLFSFQLTNEMFNYRPVYNCTNPSILGMTELKIRFDTSGIWRSTNSTIQTENIQFDIPPGGCNLNGTSFLMEKTPQGPLALPQGSYGCQGLFCGGTIIPVVAGGCPPKVRILSTENYCAGPPPKLGTAIYQGVGGSGPPYIFFFSSDGVNYQQTSVTQLLLIGGNYSIKVRDSIGTESVPVNFTINSGSEVWGPGNVIFNSNVSSYNLTGVLDRGIQDGEYRQAEFVIEHFYDFSNLPNGTLLNCSFRFDVNQDLTVGGEGHDNPFTSQVTRITFQDAWYHTNGQLSFFDIIDSPFISLNFGGEYNNSEYDTDNCGSWKPDSLLEDGVTPAYFDNCGNPPVTRTSPNRWQGCNTTRNNLSFIEGDTRGTNFSGIWDYRLGQNISVNNTSKIYLRFKIILRINSPIYIPTIINETDDSTIQPQCYTNCSVLNTSNVVNVPASAPQSRTIMSTNLSSTIISPPTVGCVNIDPTLSGLNYGGAAPGNVNTLNFRLFGNISVNANNAPFPTQQAAFNSFVTNNTTGVPSWYNQLAP